MAFFSRTKPPEPRSLADMGAGSHPAVPVPGGRDGADARGPGAPGPRPRTPLPTPAGARSRKQTLSSPIPAMLAASMLEMTDDAAEVTSVADGAAPRPTPVPAGRDHGRPTPLVLPTILEDEGDEYVVEVVPGE
jgi:hypothetical protein